MEQLEYKILFRWFVGLGMDEPVWAPTTFTKNRDRLISGDPCRREIRHAWIHVARASDRRGGRRRERGSVGSCDCGI